MLVIRPIPLAEQVTQAWANGAGSTRVIWREPDSADWQVRISVAQVERDGPFSELLDTRRSLVPLDASMRLRFGDGSEQQVERMGVLQFPGAPAPYGLLPAGPTRDFNLMLRGKARGEVSPQRLAESMSVQVDPGSRWLLYLHAGHAHLHAGVAACKLVALDAALIELHGGTAESAKIDGNGELLLVKLYA